MFKKAQVNASKVASTLSNYPTYVDLSRLGITTLAQAQSVRVYANEAKTTEWAREIVSATEMHVKIPSLTTTTEIYVDWDGVRSDYAVGDTYGRNAVWGDYLIVHHLNIYEANPTNAIGSNNGTAFSMSSSQEISAVMGGGLDMGASGRYVSTPATTMTAFTLQGVIKRNGTSGINQDSIVERATSIGSFVQMQLLRVNNTGTVNFQGRNGTGAQNFAINSSGTVTNNAWRWVVGTCTSGDQRIYIDGANDGSGAVTHGANTLATNFFTNRTYDTVARHLLAQFDEVRVRASALSANWITTEYNNQSDEASFWGTWTDAGSAPTNKAGLLVFF